MKKLESKICPTCGCSLVRLGIKEKSTALIEHNGQSYFFCCSGCATIFKEHPERYIQEIQDIVVCPVCLAEKSREQTTMVSYNDTDIPFCRCPHCISTFEEKPEYYLNRLMGKIEYEGLFNNLCC